MPRFLGALAPIVALALVGCGGGGSSAPPPTSGGGAPAPSPSPSPSPTPSPTPTGTMTFPHVFGLEAGGLGRGIAPFLLASDGFIYGQAQVTDRQCRPISPISCGAIFRYSKANGLSTFYTYGAGPDAGYSIAGALIEGSDGAIYGATSNGGANGGGGTLFKITLAGEFTQLHSFGADEFDGDGPTGGLVEGRDGNFYGVTASGGVNTCPEIPNGVGNCGTAFRMTPEGNVTLLHSFGSDAKDGILPAGPLVEAADGNFYGATQIGGEFGAGALFRMTPAGEVTTVHSFGRVIEDGQAPAPGLLLARDGTIFGATVGGRGTVFQYNPANGEFSVLFRFGATPGINDGNGAQGYLIEDTDGSLIGVTINGGSVDINGGTLYRLTRSGIHTVLFAFGPFQQNPSRPEAGVIVGPDGAFYGATADNGTFGSVGARSGSGTLFRFGR